MRQPKPTPRQAGATRRRHVFWNPASGIPRRAIEEHPPDTKSCRGRRRRGSERPHDAPQRKKSQPRNRESCGYFLQRQSIVLRPLHTHPAPLQESAGSFRQLLFTNMQLPEQPALISPKAWAVETQDSRIAAIRATIAPVPKTPERICPLRAAFCLRRLIITPLPSSRNRNQDETKTPRKTTAASHATSLINPPCHGAVKA